MAYDIFIPAYFFFSDHDFKIFFFRAGSINFYGIVRRFIRKRIYLKRRIRLNFQIRTIPDKLSAGIFYRKRLDIARKPIREIPDPANPAD